MSVWIHIKDITCIDYRSNVYIHVLRPGSSMLLRMLHIGRVYVRYVRRRNAKEKGRGEVNSPVLFVVAASSRVRSWVRRDETRRNETKQGVARRGEAKRGETRQGDSSRLFSACPRLARVILGGPFVFRTFRILSKRFLRASAPASKEERGGELVGRDGKLASDWDGKTFGKSPRACVFVAFSSPLNKYSSLIRI